MSRIVWKTKTSIRNIGIQGIRHNTITFCMLFNPINLLCTFFGELYSNIFLKSIVTPLVVNIYFLGRKITNATVNQSPKNIARLSAFVLPPKSIILSPPLSTKKDAITKHIFCGKLKILSNIVTPLVVNIYFLWGRASDDRGIDSIPPTPLCSIYHYLCHSFAHHQTKRLHKLYKLKLHSHHKVVLMNSVMQKKIKPHNHQLLVALVIILFVSLNLSCILCTACPKSIYHLGDDV